MGVTSSADHMLEPVVISYLTLVLLPSVGADVLLRISQELKNLAMALDKLLIGDVIGTVDVLVGRFQPVETVATQKSWVAAGNLEMVGEPRISSASQKQQRAVARRERERSCAQLIS